jgi:hypothetical protein
MKPGIRRDRARETLTLQFPPENAALIDERLEAVIETWKKVGNMDMQELLRSCYFQGLLDGSGIEPTEQSRRVLVGRSG